MYYDNAKKEVECYIHKLEKSNCFGFNDSKPDGLNRYK